MMNIRFGYKKVTCERYMMRVKWVNDRKWGGRGRETTHFKLPSARAFISHGNSNMPVLNERERN